MDDCLLICQRENEWAIAKGWSNVAYSSEVHCGQSGDMEWFTYSCFAESALLAESMGTV